MIKEYFTDGLIGLAILLSLFRTDLVGINNIINYPEVQDIILGQTAAYLPANFHNSPNVFGNPKHIDFDNQAFTDWYQNVQNLPLFRERSQNEIEAFLVSASRPNVEGEQFQSDHTANNVSENNGVPETSSPALPQESANSFVLEGINSTSSPEESISANGGVLVQNSDQPVVVDVTFLFNNPFPGCNLTREDLELIDVLWRQDADLGVGKEVFDQTLREELERERELKLHKQQEQQKADLLAKEKEEREKQELADQWLKKNFRRDGETGEWVRLQNATSGNSTNVGPVPLVDNNGNDESISLEAALDFLSNSVDPITLPALDESENAIGTTAFDGFSDVPVQNMQGQQFESVVPQQQQIVQQPQFVEHQDSLEESWNGLVDYLNMTSTCVDETTDNTSSPSLGDQINSSIVLASDVGLGQEVNSQMDYLIQNATLPSPGMDIGNDLTTLTTVSELNSPMTLQPASNASVDFDLGDFNFFDDMPVLENSSIDDFDLSEVDDLFRSIQGTSSAAVMDGTMDLAEGMDAIQMFEDNFSSSAASMGSASSHNDFTDTFGGLEGATGGSDLNGSHGDMNDRYSKVSRLSESSNDSGFAYQSSFSSASSAPSSYAGSPASSNGMNSSTTSNDTEHDPHGTRAVAHHHVAHNHTYNTPPGQVPREVKKYAQKEPSRKGPHSRDQRRAEELKIPFTVDAIVESPVETFNEMLTAHKLTEGQMNLIRDIRRRGKNKVAAQNCRKRKVDVIFNLSDEKGDLEKMRDRLLAERASMERETRKMKEKFGHLYTQIFQSLRNEHGEPYDPNLYSLQQSSDGSVFLVPRNLSVSSKNGSSSSASSSSPSSSKDSTDSKKRKTFDQ